MAQLRVLLGFADASDHVLEETTGHVLASLYSTLGVGTFPAPPVPETVLHTQMTDFTTAIAAQKEGGPQSTAAKAADRATLITLLRQLAAYVQSVMLANPQFGLAELLSSGFDAVSTNRAQHPLAKAHISGIDNAGAGQLEIRSKPVANARNYEVQTSTDNGATWQLRGLFGSTKGLVVSGLTAGTMYSLRVRAVGGSTGYGEWSDPVSHMSL